MLVLVAGQTLLLPQWAGAAAADAHWAPAVVGPAPPSHAPVHGADDGADKIIKGKKRNAQLCLRILSRQATLRTSVAMRIFAEPVEFEHHETMAGVKSIGGCRSMLEGYVRMNYNDYLFKVLALLSSPKVVTELLFEHTCNGEEDRNISDDWIVAKACFNLALNTFGQ